MRVEWPAGRAGTFAGRLVALGFRVADGGRSGEPSVDLVGGRIALVGEREGGTPPGATAPALRVEETTPREEGGMTRHPNGISTLVGIGWATVDLARTARGSLVAAAGTDDLLGARALVLRRPPGSPGLALLEPTTEGHLAATLARHGEGPAVVYVGAVDLDLGALAARWRSAGARVAGPALTPFGRGILPAAPVAGPHLVAVAIRRPSPPLRPSRR